MIAFVVLHLGLQDRDSPPYPRLSVNSSYHQLPAVLLGDPAAGAELTTAQATGIARAAWDTRETALVDRQVGTIHELEVGGAEAIDQTYLENLFHGDGPVVFSGIRSADHINIFLPPFSGYQPYFVAAISTAPSASLTAASNLLILSRTSRTGPWRISFQVGSFDRENNENFPEPVRSQAGYDVIDCTNNIPSGNWLNNLATYYSSWKDTARAPSPDLFAPGYLTDQKGRELTKNAQGSTTGYSRQTFAFSAPAPNGQWLVGYGGIATECGYIDELETDMATGGALNQDHSRVNWGPPLPPGQYGQIKTTYLYPVCVTPDFGHGNRFKVFGNLDSPTTVTGVS